MRVFCEAFASFALLSGVSVSAHREHPGHLGTFFALRTSITLVSAIKIKERHQSKELNTGNIAVDSSGLSSSEAALESHGYPTKHAEIIRNLSALIQDMDDAQRSSLLQAEPLQNSQRDNGVDSVYSSGLPSSWATLESRGPRYGDPEKTASNARPVRSIGDPSALIQDVDGGMRSSLLQAKSQSSPLHDVVGTLNSSGLASSRATLESHGLWYGHLERKSARKKAMNGGKQSFPLRAKSTRSSPQENSTSPTNPNSPASTVHGQPQEPKESRASVTPMHEVVFASFAMMSQTLSTMMTETPIPGNSRYAPFIILGWVACGLFIFVVIILPCLMSAWAIVLCKIHSRFRPIQSGGWVSAAGVQSQEQRAVRSSQPSR